MLTTMTTDTTRATPHATTARQMLNKVPEVTVYFWIIKILCTTVGESFADYINETLGFGLTNTTLVFSLALAIALVAQFRVDRYVPGIYWLSVVLISVVGTLLADNLTRPLGANIGDYLGSPHADGGLGLGTLGTSVLFLGTIVAVVVYLTKTQKDRTELVQPESRPDAA